MKRIKKVIALLLVLTMLMAAVPAVVYAALEEEGYMSVRQFFESVGGTVEWDEAERIIIVEIEGGTIVFFPNQTTVIINGNPVEIENAILISQGVSYFAEADLETIIMVFNQTLFPTATFYLTEEARDIALEDFDYMVNFVLENSVWDNVLYRRWGLDFAAHAAQHRQLIEEMVPVEFPVTPYFPIREDDDPRSLAANYLISLLAFSFAQPFGGIGHLVPRDVDLYRALLTSFAQAHHENPENQSVRILYETYSHPSAVWFYGEHEVDLDGGDIVFPQVIGNVTAEIIVPDEVAYLGIASFLTDMEFDDLVIRPFLEEVRDFDHLIIDIRSNGGGLMSYFNQLILFRLINEPVEILEYQFFTSGETAEMFMNASMRDTLEAFADEDNDIEGIELISYEIMSSLEFVEQQGMTEFNPDDLERLSNVLVARSAIFPDLLPEEDRIGFGGSVWLLIDEYSASASNAAALTSMLSGFATVVGENSTGVMGAAHIYIALPNTGIIWRTDIGYIPDSVGRSLEEHGITPDIRNRPGMDALETVLAIIEEERGN